MRTFTISASAVALALLGVTALYAKTYLLHHDLAGGLLTGGLAFALGDAFGDYSTYFPPAERFWYVLAVKIGATTGIGADTAVILQTFAATVFSAWLGYLVRHRTVGADVFFFVVPFVVLLALPILYKNIFGLREHLIVLGFWPYLVLRAAGEEAKSIGLRLRLMLGLWLGFTLVFKYFYSIVVFLIELADAALARRFLLLFRPENLIAGSIVFLYLLLWLGIDPAQREAIALMQTAIAANRVGLEGMLYATGQLSALGLSAALLLLRWGVAPRIILLGLAAVLGAIIIAAMQQRWYTHHMFPVVMAFLGWWWLVGASFPRWLHVVPALLLLVPVYQQFENTRFYEVRTAELQSALAAAGISLAGKRVALLSQHPSPFSQVMVAQGSTRWSPQVNISYVSSELLPFDTPANRDTLPPPVTLQDPGQRLLHDRMIGLWENQLPDAMVLDTSFQWPLRYLTFQWEQVFADDPGFQRVFSEFEPVLSHETDRLNFTYYERRR